MEPYFNFIDSENLSLSEGNTNTCCQDQAVNEDFIDELVRKYLLDENVTSLYEDSTLGMACPETEQWMGQVIPSVLNDSQDFMVPDLCLVENMDAFSEKYDSVDPEEELLSILEEIISEEEMNAAGYSEKKESVTEDTIKNTGSKAKESLTKPTSLKRKRPRKSARSKKDQTSSIDRPPSKKQDTTKEEKGIKIKIN